MDEFMDMVFNNSDVLNVDLKQLQDIEDPTKYLQLMKNLMTDINQAQQSKHQNQLTLILQNNINQIYHKLLTSDS